MPGAAPSPSQTHRHVWDGLRGDGKGAPTPRWVTPSPREDPAPSGLQRPWKAREGGIQAGGLRKQQPDRGVGIHREPCTAPRRLEGAGRRRLRADFSAVDGSGGLGWGRRHRPPRPAEPPSPAGSGAALPCQPQPRRPRAGPAPAPPPRHRHTRGVSPRSPPAPQTTGRGEPPGTPRSTRPRRPWGSPRPRRSRGSVPREIPVLLSLPCETAEPATHFPSKAAP